MSFINYETGEGTGIIALLVLAIILVIYELIKRNKPTKETEEYKEVSPLNIEDEDATVACLVAAIDYRNETHKNIRIVSVKEVK